MIGDAVTASHRASRRAIDAHFGGRASPALERSLRAHLPGCGPCKTYYQHHMVLARLDPRRLGARDRIARGLGLATAAPRSAWWWAARAAVAVSVVAVFVVIAPGARPTALDTPAEFAVRGAGSAAARTPGLSIYRVGQDGDGHLAEAAIGAADELAFAYSNPTGKRFIMVFAVDEHRHVFWFHPAWPAGEAPPVAVPAAAGPGPHELPEAIRHRFDGRRLNVYGVFGDRAIDAAAIEAAARRAGAPDALSVAGDGVVMIRRTFQVQP